MKILHLSDFHFKSTPKDIAQQDLLVAKLCDSLATIDGIDFFLFTGDLVYSGDNSNDFIAGYETLIVKVAKTLKLQKSQVLFCAGNHDVSRKEVSVSLKEYMRKINTDKDLEKYISKDNLTEYELSCKPIKNYVEFEKKFFNDLIISHKDVVTNLYSTHVRQMGSVKVGFVSINTAWCSTGNDDEGNLYFPVSELEKAISIINKENVTWKILLLHHPLGYFRGFNKIDLEDIIYNEFHFLFAGHLHKRSDFIQLTFNEGIFGSHANAAFTKKEDGRIGFTVLDVDFETIEIKMDKYIYDFSERLFMKMPEVVFTLPCSEIKEQQIKIYKTLKKRLIESFDKANELLISFKNQNYDKNFLELFVQPVLKRKPDFMINNSNPRVDFETLYKKENFLIYGKDKTGKSTILFKLYMEILKRYAQVGEVPIYIDLNEFKSNSSGFDLKKIFSRHLESSFDKTDKVLHKYQIKLLIDNFDPSNSNVVKKLSNFFKEYPSATYVITTDQTLVRSYEKFDYGIDGYQSLYVHDISRKEVRQLTEKWPNIPINKREEFIDRIVDVLKQHNMPFNYWTLSIFLWIFAGKNTLNFNNNSELIELYIDDLLDRNKLASDPQNRFSYQNYKILLSELAHELLTNFSKYNYAMSFPNLVIFTNKFMQENPKRVGAVSDVVNYLLDRGVLKKLDGDLVTFRLNGVFEYFIAFNFNENKGFLQEMISNDAYYLSFKNEYEIYSGFTRSEADNKEFLEKIFEKTEKAFADLNEKMIDSLDVLLSQSIEGKELLDITKPLKEIATRSDFLPLTANEKDEIMDEVGISTYNEVEVQPKKLYDVSIKNFEILERYLEINGKVFKNIDNIKDREYIEKIFDFIVMSACNLGFLLIQELENKIDQNIQDATAKSPERLIIMLLNNYLPSVVQKFIQTNMGHINLEAIIETKIKSYNETTSSNQYILFILNCLLLDIDLKRHKIVIDNLISITKMGIIKTSILIKLLELLLFKSYDDDSMIAYLKERIRRVNLMIDPKVNMTEFDKSFERTRKILLLKRQSN